MSGTSDYFAKRQAMAEEGPSTEEGREIAGILNDHVGWFDARILAVMIEKMIADRLPAPTDGAL